MSEIIVVGCLSPVFVLFFGCMRNKKPILQVTLILSLVASSLTLSVLSTSYSVSYPKGTVAATIAKEVDGDLIYVTINHKTIEIRMLLIDTP